MKLSKIRKLKFQAKRINGNCKSSWERKERKGTEGIMNKLVKENVPKLKDIFPG